jgi:bacterioferritin-associated ferredoxin
MIVCSCNVLTDHDVRDAARSATRRSTSQVYGCLGCSAQCGRCARTIRKIIDETVGVDALACPVGCACALHINTIEPRCAHEHHAASRRIHAHPRQKPQPQVEPRAVPASG